MSRVRAGLKSALKWCLKPLSRPFQIHFGYGCQLTRTEVVEVHQIDGAVSRAYAKNNHWIGYKYSKVTDMQGLKLEDIMRREVVTVAPSVSLRQVLSSMTHSTISAIVITEGRAPIGIFTERDAVLFAYGHGMNLNIPIREVMSRDPICLTQDKDIYEAYQLMQDQGIRHLLVVDTSDTFTGLVTEEDFISQLESQLFDQFERIEQIMSRHLITGREGETFHTALHRMIQRRVSCIVVGRDHQITGILSERDVARLLLQGCEPEVTLLADIVSRPPYSINQKDSLLSARRMMVANQVRHLVVIDEDGQWTGLITRHDLAKVINTIFRQVHQRQEAYFRRLYDEAPLPYQSLDENGTLLEVNQTWLNIFGYTKAQVIGHFIGEFLVPGQETRLNHQFVNFISSGTVKGAEFTIKCGSGQEKQVKVDGHIVREKTGRFLHTNCILTDISETRKAQEALNASQEKYRNLVESIPAVVYQASLPPDFMTTYLSPQSERIFGYSQQDAEDDPGFWRRAIYLDDKPSVLAELENLHSSDAPISMEYRMYDKAGRLIWVRDDVRMEYDELGRPVQIQGVLLDITQRKTLEEKLQRSNRELEALINSIPVPVYFMNRKLCYQMVNRAYLDFIGLREDEVVGKHDRELFPQDLAREFEMSDQQVLDEGRTFEDIEQQVPDFKGNLCWFSTRKTPIMNTAGEITGLVGISFEITELKQGEQKRREEEQKQRNALIQEVHHRIKNHLQGVVNLMRLQSNKGLADPVRAESIISQIRTIAEVYGLQSNSETGHVYVCDMVEAALKIHQATSKLKINFQHKLVERAALVPSESVPVALVINELITNAIKHSEPAGTDTPIDITLHTDARSALLAVSNPAESLPEEFDPEGGEQLGTGLRLVRTLLPPQGSRLTITQASGTVSAELSLAAPVVTQHR